MKKDDPNFGTIHAIVVTWIEIFGLLQKDKKPLVHGSPEWIHNKVDLAREICIRVKKVKELHLSLPHGRSILMSSYSHHVLDGHVVEQVSAEIIIFTLLVNSAVCLYPSDPYPWSFIPFGE